MDRTPLLPDDPERLARIAQLYRELLVELGEDPAREGLRDTPDRVARWWAEFLNRGQNSAATSFAEPSRNGQLVVVRDISVWSLCEHHLLPFRVELAIGYLPSGRVLGLSKFVRIADRFAGRLQLQERLVDTIAQEIVRATGSQDVAVLAHGEHLCMSMRGVQRDQARTTSTVLLGRLDTEPVLTTRFLAAAQSAVRTERDHG